MAAEKIKPQHLSKPTTKQRKRKINCNKVIKLAKQGVTACEIAKIQGVAPSTVSRYLAEIGLERQALTEYKNNRADIKSFIGMKAEEKQLECLAKINIDALPDATKNGFLMATNAIIGTRYQEERLERNQSTANISTAHGITPEMQELYDKITGRAKVEGQTGENQKVEQDSLLITQE